MSYDEHGHPEYSSDEGGEIEAGDGFNIFYGGSGEDIMLGGENMDFM